MASPVTSHTGVAASVRTATAGSALKSVVAQRANRVLFAVLAVGVTLAYSLTLPFAFTQRLSLHNWQFLTPRLGGFALEWGISSPELSFRYDPRGQPDIYDIVDRTGKITYRNGVPVSTMGDLLANAHAAAQA